MKLESLYITYDLEPTFGVGDIVEFNREDAGLVSDKPNPHYGNKTTIGRINKWTTEGVLLAGMFFIETEAEGFFCKSKDLKLIFPASKIPKELDGIRVGDVVELTTGYVGRVVAIENEILPQRIHIQIWSGKKFYVNSYESKYIKRTIWKSHGTSGN